MVNVLPTLVGVILGFVLAVLYDLITHNRRTDAQNKIFEDRLLDRLQFNLDRMTQMLNDYLLKNGTPTFRLDVSSMNNILSHGRTLFDKNKLRDIDRRRYEYEHINSKLHLLPFLPTIREQLIEHIQIEISKTKEILNQKI